jgi:hypothetical protein
MCLFGGGGGGGGQPQVIYKDVYKDAPLAPLPAPMPTPMATGVESASNQQVYADGTEPTNKSMGTSIFKINRDPAVSSNDYQDQGLDSGLYY